VAEASQLDALLLQVVGVIGFVRANPCTAADDSGAADFSGSGFAGVSGFTAVPRNGGIAGVLVNSVNGSGPREAVDGGYAANARGTGLRSVPAVRSDPGRFSLGAHIPPEREDRR
jgi:hypothetical protein